MYPCVSPVAELWFCLVELQGFSRWGCLKADTLSWWKPMELPRNVSTLPASGAGFGSCLFPSGLKHRPPRASQKRHFPQLPLGPAGGSTEAAARALHQQYRSRLTPLPRSFCHNERLWTRAFSYFSS